MTDHGNKSEKHAVPRHLLGTSSFISMVTGEDAEIKIIPTFSSTMDIKTFGGRRNESGQFFVREWKYVGH